MRLVFFGTPGIALPALDALHGSRHEITAVVTRPDRPAGRGRRLKPPPVKERALELGLEVLQPQKARDAVDLLVGADVFVVVAYGGWLPPVVLEAAPYGCVNLHPSLLPRWRGAAPVERALMAGDLVTGVTSMQIDEGLDTGPMLLQERCAVEPGESAGELAQRLGTLGADLIVRTLDGLEEGTVRPVPQSEDGVTYAEKLEPESCRVDWSASVAQIDGLVRGANPRPGAWTELAGRRLKLWQVRPAQATGGQVGSVLSTEPLLVAAGDGAVELVEVQPEGKPRMDGAAFSRGHREVMGMRLS